MALTNRMPLRPGLLLLLLNLARIIQHLFLIHMPRKMFSRNL
jgi:hypothetical protein